jgi:hypothetical protein
MEPIAYKINTATVQGTLSQTQQNIKMFIAANMISRQEENTK